MTVRSSRIDSLRRRVTAVGAVALMVGGLVAIGAPSASAAAVAQTAGVGTPTVSAPLASPTAVLAGVPQAPSLVWNEDFEAGMPDPPVARPLASYTSATGVTYTSDPYWRNLTQCNGVLLNWNSNTPIPSNAGTWGPSLFAPPMCTAGDNGAGYSQLNVRRLADVLGQVGQNVVGGTPAAPVNASNAASQKNAAVAEWTTNADGKPTDKIVAKSSTFSLSNVATIAQFYSISVDVAEVSCTYLGGINNSKLDFFLNAAGTDIKVNSSPIQACSDRKMTYYTSPVPKNLVDSPATWGNAGTYVGAGRFFTDRGLLLTPAQLSAVSVRMENETYVSGGNDFAFDNIRISNTTPSLEKSFTPSTITQGDTSRLTFTATNTSELGMKSGWSFTDNLPAGVVVSADPQLATTCADPTTMTADPGSSTVSVNGTLASGSPTCTVSVNVTGATPGQFVNATANVPTQGITPPADAVLTVVPRIAPSITKTATEASYVAGTPLSYQVVIGNAASTATVPISTITGMTVNDPMPAQMTGASWTCTTTGGATCSPGGGNTLTDTVTVPAGASITYTISGTAGPGSSGSATNTATVTPPTTGTIPAAGGGTIEVPLTNVGCGSTGQPACAAAATIPDAALTVAKSPSVPTVARAGDPVTYSFLVTNTGHADLTGITITDTLTAPAGPALVVTCPPTTLVPGATLTCTAPYVTTQADVDHGRIDNSATAAATRPGSTTPIVSSPSTAVVTAPSAPALTVVKTPNVASAKVGDQVTYSFLVTNSGNVSLSNVSVSDVFVAPAGPAVTVSCPGTDLAVGGSMTCSSSAYSVTQADVDNGSVTNTAIAHGTPPTPPGGQTPPPVDSPPSTAVVTTPQAPALTVVKTPNVASAKVGDQVTYSFLVTNSGNVSLSNVSVSDVFVAPAGPAVTVSCPGTDLAVGGSITCTSSPYSVTTSDVDNGSVNNTAVAHGTPPTPPGGPTPPPVDSPPSTAVVTTPQAPALTVVKTPSVASAKVGDQVTYSFLVTNSGNVSLSNVSVSDVFVAPAGPAVTVSCPGTDLAVGGSMTCSSSPYSVTQADLDNGSVTNTAVAHGTPPTPPGGTPPAPVDSPPSTAVVTTPQAPALTVVKSVLPMQVTAAGQAVAYSFLVTNTGNVTLSNVSVSDALVAPAGPALVVTCPSTVLAPGDVVTCTAPYTVTQADVDNGSVNNTAVAHGTPPTPPGGPTPPPVDSPPSSAVVTIPPTPSLTVLKSVLPAAATKAGDTVSYSFLVTNTGNVNLTAVGIDDTLMAPAGPALVVTCPSTVLARGDVVTCTAPYTVTQADVNNGSVNNTAVAHGTPPTPPGGQTPPPVDSPPSSAVVTIPPTASLTVVKTPSVASAKVGDQVTYSFLVTNSGNVSLSNVSVSDVFVAPAGPAVTVTCPGTDLAGGGSMTCTAPYTVTQADVDNGSVTNTAIAHGTPPTPPGGQTPPPVDSPPSTAVVTTPQAASLSVVKNSDLAAVSAVGDVVHYTFVVTNTGNVSLSNVSVSDVFVAPAGPAVTVTCPGTDLAVGGSMTCTSSPYSVTQADLDNGSVNNTAVAHGTPPTPPGGQTPPPVDSPPSTKQVPAQMSPSLSLMKSADPSTVDTAGRTVTYSFRITNTGNVTLTSVGVDDALTAPAGPALTVTCPSTALPPGGSLTCTAPYTVTRADVAHGRIDNVATAHGTTQGGARVNSAKSLAVVLIPATGATPLPKTGADLLVIAYPAALILALGIGLLAVTRRRRT